MNLRTSESPRRILQSAEARCGFRRSTLRAALTAIVVLSGCAGPSRIGAVPDELADRAVVFGMPAARSWSDPLSEPFLNEVRVAGEREIGQLRAAGRGDSLPPANYLAISGGGANGAYGAGLLCGWSETGTRPEFKVVTGISTGALTAPFAFLGSAYDQQLRDVYTGIRTADILTPRNMLAGLLGDALTDNAPLWRLLQKKVNESMMRDIAAEYAKGRFLLIGTTNLDAQRGVVWNVTAIAASGNPRALELIHKILIASAAIPAAFPPIMIDVEIDGKSYQEMHVDGGAVAQVFFYPPSMRLTSRAVNVDRERRLYVIRNGRVDAQWAEVQRRTLPIASRAIDSLITTQGLGDLYRLFLTSRRDAIDFNLAFIPSTFKEKPKEAFDPEYMRKLFDIGFAAAKDSTAWFKTPPGLLLAEPQGK
jgi:predicted acylesterase/phospholipase RssA